MGRLARSCCADRPQGEQHTAAFLSGFSFISALGIKGYSEKLILSKSMTLTVSCCQEVAVRTESQHPYSLPRVRSVSYWLQSLQDNWPRGDLIWNTAGKTCRVPVKGGKGKQASKCATDLLWEEACSQVLWWTTERAPSRDRPMQSGAPQEGLLSELVPAT